MKKGSDAGKFGSDVVRDGAQGDLAGGDFFVIREGDREGEETVVRGVLFLEIIGQEEKQISRW